MKRHHTILHSIAINGIYCHIWQTLNTDLTKYTVEAFGEDERIGEVT